MNPPTLLCLATSLIVGCAKAPPLHDGATPPTPTSSPAPTDEAPTDELPTDETRALEDLSDRMAGVLAVSGAPAVVGGIVDEEGLYAAGVAGVRRTDRPDRATLDDRWHLGSNTKAMTATLVGTFVDEGALTFDTTLPELFPGVAADPAWSSVEMADLLRHRAGVGEGSRPRPSAPTSRSRTRERPTISSTRSMPRSPS